MMDDVHITNNDLNEISHKETTILCFINSNHINLPKLSQFLSFKLNFLFDHSVLIEAVVFRNYEHIVMVFQLQRCKLFKRAICKRFKITFEFFVALKLVIKI